MNRSFLFHVLLIPCLLLLLSGKVRANSAAARINLVYLQEDKQDDKDKKQKKEEKKPEKPEVKEVPKARKQEVPVVVPPRKGPVPEKQRGRGNLF